MSDGPSLELDFRDVLDAVNDCVFVHDDTGAVAYVNRAAERQYGYTAEEIRRLSPDQLSQGIPPYTADEALGWVRRALTEGPQVFPWVARRRNGQTFFVEVALRATRMGQRNWVIAVVRDVDAERRALEKLKTSEDRLARVFNSSSNAMAITRRSDGRIVEVNRTWLEMSGLPAGTAIGRTAFELGLWADAAERERCVVQLRERGSVRDFEARINTVRGPRRFHLSAEGFALPDFEAVLWELRDVEDWRLLEQQLHQAQKLESVGRLAGGVAHDFNNMVGVILGNVELMLIELAPDHPMRESVLAVRQAAERSAALTRHLLAFARRQVVAPRRLDPNEAVESMLTMLRQLIGDDLDLVWQPGHDIGTVLMDPVQLDQILANLCVNARDAMAGAGKVTIETRRLVVAQGVADAAPGPYVRLTVRDTGHGVPVHLLDKIFEPFFTTKPVGQGTGLGLSTVYGIARQNGGFVTVENMPDGGASFHVHLPCASTAAHERPAERSTAPQQTTHGEQILLVEDEPAMMQMMLTMLSRQGYIVRTAASPADAESLAADPKVAIDAVVTDIVMPGMNGYDLVSRLRLLRPALKALFVSGHPADVLDRHGAADALGAFVAKPFTSHELTSRLRDVLDGRQ